MASEGAAWSSIGVVFDLHVDPAAPARAHAGNAEKEREQQHRAPRGAASVWSCASCGYLHAPISPVSAAAPSRSRGWESRPRAESPSGPGPSERSTMVVGCARPVGPPSMMSGMRSPIWSRTQAAWVHSAAPCRLAEVAVMGSPKRSTTARGNGCVGHAQRHVAGVGRGAQRQLGSGADDDGERAGPEAVGELVEHGGRCRAPAHRPAPARRSAARAACASAGS